MHRNVQKRVLMALAGVTDPNVLRRLVFELAQIGFANMAEEDRLWGVISAQHVEIHRLRSQVEVLLDQDGEPE